MRGGLHPVMSDALVILMASGYPRQAKEMLEMIPPANLVKRLREETGISLRDAHNYLRVAGGSYLDAKELIRGILRLSDHLNMVMQRARRDRD